MNSKGGEKNFREFSPKSNVRDSYIQDWKNLLAGVCSKNYKRYGITDFIFRFYAKNKLKKFILKISMEDVCALITGLPHFE
jgi:hypothetical protein